MELRVGRIVKLKDYTHFTRYKDQYAEVMDIPDEFGSVELRWVIDRRIFSTGETNVEVEKWQTIATVYEELKEGNIVLTNGDGRTTGAWIFGEIGEKTTSHMYIWNNQECGDNGTKKVIGYKYSWIVGANSLGKIIVVKESDVPDKCQLCKKHFEMNELTRCIDAKYYCEDCKNEEFVYCTECNNQVHNDDADANDNGEYFCYSCYNELYSTCAGCDEEVRKEEAHHAEDAWWCDDCFNERFTCCDNCGNVYRFDDLIYDEEADQHYCGNCHRKKVKRVIHDYGYIPKFEFNRLAWDEPLYMGVELEVQREVAYEEYAAKFLKFLKEQGTDKHFYLKHDGTLRDANGNYQGFEMVTQPFTLQYAHKNLGFNKILKWLKDNKYDYGEQTQRCGLHIHISRDFFEEMDVTKLRIFFRQNQAEIFKFSKRKSKINEYCKYETIDAIEMAKGRGQEGNNHHTAIDAQTAKQTVEIRVFNSTLDAERFIAILQFVDALAHFVKVVGITSLLLGEGEYHKNSWKLFIDWAKAEGKYEKMLQQLHKEKLIKA